jgi:hypothetical protein
VVFAYMAPHRPNQRVKRERQRGLKENDHLPHGEAEEWIRAGPGGSGGARLRPRRGGKERGKERERGGGGSTPLLTSGASGVGRCHLSGDNELRLRYWWWHDGVRERDGATGYGVAANGGLAGFTSAGGT